VQSDDFIVGLDSWTGVSFDLADPTQACAVGRRHARGFDLGWIRQIGIQVVAQTGFTAPESLLVEFDNIRVGGAPGRHRLPRVTSLAPKGPSWC